MFQSTLLVLYTCTVLYYSYLNTSKGQFILPQTDNAYA